MSIENPPSIATPPAAGRKAWYLLHSWSGAVLGLALYAVFVTGCLLLFMDSMQTWQYPELRALGGERHGSAPVESATAAAGQGAAATPAINFPLMIENAQAAGLISDEAVFHLPASSRGVMLRQGDQVAVFHPRSGALLGVRDEGALRFLRVLHTDLLLPFPVGLIVGGLLGIALLLLAVTGLVVHRRFYLHLFTWRRRQFRLAWADAHKLAGTWGALFYVLFGLSGAILGLISIFLMITAGAAYEGGYAAVNQDLKGAAVQASGQPAALPDFNAILARGRNEAPEMEVEFLTVEHIGDANTRVILEGVRPDYLSALALKAYDGQGRQLHVVDDVGQGPGLRTYVMLMALHFADFGGLPVRLAYLLLGLATAFMPVSGLLLWLHRREQRRHHQAAAPLAGKLARLSLGCGLGLPAAMAAVLAADRLGYSSHSALLTVLLAVLGLFMLGAVAMAGLRRQGQWGLALAGLLWLGVAVVDVWRYGIMPGAAAQTDLVFALIGLLMMAAAWGVRWRVRQHSAAPVLNRLHVDGEPGKAG